MWGGLLGNKRPDRGKKISGGQKFSGGTFGEMQKRGGKTFFGECWGSCEPQKILGGEFLEKCQRKKFGGEILGVVRPTNSHTSLTDTPV